MKCAGLAIALTLWGFPTVCTDIDNVDHAESVKQQVVEHDLNTSTDPIDPNEVFRYPSPFLYDPGRVEKPKPSFPAKKFGVSP